MSFGDDTLDPQNNKRWSNGHMEAWVNPDGTLIIKTKVPVPMDGHPYHYTVDCLNPVP